MGKIRTQQVFKIPFTDQNTEKEYWTLHIEGDGKNAILSLHWKDKPYPKHLASIRIKDLKNIIEIMGQEDEE